MSGTPPSASDLQVTLSSFLISLGRTALQALGDTPESLAATDLPLARQTIDLLGLLQEKTKGNLDPEEQKLLESMLYELRIRYTRRAGAAG